MNRLSIALVAALALSGCASSAYKQPELPSPSPTAKRVPINQVSAVDVRGSRLVPGASEVKPPAPEPEGDQVKEVSYPLTTRFIFGITNPVVVCSPGHLCDVELQVGEKVSAVRIGDKARWKIEGMSQGQGVRETQHLTLTPTESGIETSMLVITDRRTYHLLLRARRSISMLHAKFIYPEDMASQWNAIESANAAK